MERVHLDRVDQEIGYFNRGVVHLNPPASPADITAAQQQLSVHFAPSLRRFLEWHNGGWIVRDGVYGVPPIERQLDLVHMTTLYRRLHNDDWPLSFLIIADDGCGNPYVVVTDKVDERGESPVVLVNGISLEVEFVAGSNYLTFVWFMVHDLARIRRPDGEYLPDDELDRLDPDWRTSWMVRPDFMLAHDPDVARWRSVFGLEPGEP
jgi:hypothetical protein